MTQQKQVIKYFKDNKNKPMHFKSIANELNILVPNMRRILGQGTLKGIFTRVSKGVYKLNTEDVKPNFKPIASVNLITKLNDVLINDNGNIKINKNKFNMLLNSVNDNEKTILKNLI